MARKHIEDGPKGAASRGRARQSIALQYCYDHGRDARAPLLFRQKIVQEIFHPHSVPSVSSVVKKIHVSESGDAAADVVVGIFDEVRHDEEAVDLR